MQLTKTEPSSGQIGQCGGTQNKRINKRPLNVLVNIVKEFIRLRIIGLDKQKDNQRTKFGNHPKYQLQIQNKFMPILFT